MIRFGLILFAVTEITLHLPPSSPWAFEEEVVRRMEPSAFSDWHMKTHESALTGLSGHPHPRLLYRYCSNETISLLLDCSLQPVLPNFLFLLPLHCMTFCIICFFITSSHCDTTTANLRYCQEINGTTGPWGEDGVRQVYNVVNTSTSGFSLKGLCVYVCVCAHVFA